MWEGKKPQFNDLLDGAVPGPMESHELGLDYKVTPEEAKLVWKYLEVVGCDLNIEGWVDSVEDQPTMVSLPVINYTKRGWQEIDMVVDFGHEPTDDEVDDLIKELKGLKP
jgi:hypothetical protein